MSADRNEGRLARKYHVAVSILHSLQLRLHKGESQAVSICGNVLEGLEGTDVKPVACNYLGLQGQVCLDKTCHGTCALW